MRYTEKEYTRASFTDKISLLRFFIVNILAAPYRLCKEVSTKIIYLGHGEIVKIFNCASIMNGLLLLTDVYKMVTARSLSVGGTSLVAKCLSLASMIGAGVYFNSKTKDLVEIKNIEKIDEIIPQIQESQDIEEKFEVSIPEVEEEIDLAALLEESKNVGSEEQEFSRQLSCDLLDTVFYPSTEAKDMLNANEISYSTRMAFSVEKDFLNMATEESIEEITARMYSDPQVEYSASDEALSFQDIEDLLSF